MFWRVSDGIPPDLPTMARRWVHFSMPESEDEPPLDQEMMDHLPWLVVEEPRQHDIFVNIYHKDENKPLPPIQLGRRGRPPAARWARIATFHLIAPSRRQVSYTSVLS